MKRVLSDAVIFNNVARVEPFGTREGRTDEASGLSQQLREAKTVMVVVHQTPHSMLTEQDVRKNFYFTGRLNDFLFIMAVLIF